MAVAVKVFMKPRLEIGMLSILVVLKQHQVWNLNAQ